MRTTAEGQPAGAAPAAGPAARGAGAPRAVAPAAPVPEPISVAVTTVRMLRVEQGLYALRVGELAGRSSEIAGMSVPAAQVSVPFAGDGNGLEIVTSFPRADSWLGREGGTVILRSPAGGGYAVVTAYGDPAQHTQALALDLRRLDRIEAEAAGQAAVPGAASQPGVDAASGDVPTEILVHIERAGDRLFPGRGWVGALGRRMRIEAFSIRPLERLAPPDIEMKGYLPNGGETPWIPGGVLCGTRGRGLPLIGFALRIVPQQAERYEVAYQGSFFAGGISELRRNGEPCRGRAPDDPLEAINVRVIDREGEAENSPIEP